MIRKIEMMTGRIAIGAGKMVAAALVACTVLAALVARVRSSARETVSQPVMG